MLYPEILNGVFTELYDPGWVHRWIPMKLISMGFYLYNAIILCFEKLV